MGGAMHFSIRKKINEVIVFFSRENIKLNIA